MPKNSCISLNGDWTLYYQPEKAGKNEAYDPGMLTKYSRIPAQVPGNVELDLMRAGLECDPLYGENLYKYAKYEYYQWLYVKDIFVPSDFSGDRIILHFRGLDTLADVYVNDLPAGHAQNMFIEHEFDVTDLIQKGCGNRIVVHIHSVMNDARAKEYTMAMRGTAHRNEICWLRKAPHCFGWDIAPRLVSAGIWRGVELSAQSNTRITETYYSTPELAQDGIYLEYGYRFTTDADTLEGFRIRVTGSCGDSRFEHELAAHFVSANHGFLIRNPLLWWPAGYGAQPLYSVRMELWHHGEVVDAREEKIGLRVFHLERSFTPGKQEFKMFVNGEPIMAKGTNWVPLDALHSRDAGRVERAFSLVREAGCNIMRCWGGNVYEDNLFFDLCDEYGVMVWQDFAMGNTNYPQTDDFVPALEQEMGSLIRKIRNHPCLILWSSDNEIDLKNTWYHYERYESRYNRVAHETLVRIVQAHDPYRLLLRSSPEIPEGFHTDDVPEQHTWGPRAYFKDDFYKNSTAHFIGEAGYHGCPAPSSLKKFLPENRLWPYTNDAWAMHSTEDIRIEPIKGSRNQLMANQVHLLFGERPGDLDRFALLSQISQAEAMKFFVEHTRAMKWRRTGIIWWNMLDCWPQISDAVVDYYFTKKLAFHYLKRAQRPICLLLDEPAGWLHPVLLCNDSREDKRVAWRIEDGDSGETLLSGECLSPANKNITLGDLKTPSSEQRLYLLKWSIDGVSYGSHYISGYPVFDGDKMIRWLEIIRALPDSFELEL